jgi:uncharacterized membrane protein YccC
MRLSRRVDRPTLLRLRQALQTASAALASYLLADALGLPQGYWAVITAILVVQASIGGSIGLAVDRLMGTILGAVVGTSLVYMLGLTPPALAGALFAAVLPLAFVATRRPGLRIAPVTAAIVLLSAQGQGAPLDSALVRIGEIGMGSLIALATTLLLFPARAGHALAETAGEMLRLIGSHLELAFGAALGPRDEEALQACAAGLRTALARGDTLVAEVRRELFGRSTEAADPAAVLRTTRRLWHTALMMSRAVRLPLAAAAAERLGPPLQAVRQPLREALEGLAAAFAGGRPPPDLAPALAPLAAFDEAMKALRQSGITRAMGGEEVARLFAFAFALGQLPQNLQDLADRCAELSRTRHGR